MQKGDLNELEEIDNEPIDWINKVIQNWKNPHQMNVFLYIFVYVNYYILLLNLIFI